MSDLTSSPATNRNLTAFFDTREDADEAMTRLRALGLSDANVRLSGGEGISCDVASEEPKGFWDSVSDFFLPEEARETYAEGMRRGGYLVTVSGISEEQFYEVVDILDDEGSVDLDERSESWRAEGWQGSATAASGTVALDASEGTAISSEGDTARAANLSAGAEDEVIPVVQEQLRVGKRDMSLGRVRVRSYVVEEPVSEDVSLREERVEIERRPVDREVEVGDASFVDRTIEAEQRAEEAVVQKEARVVEEIGLRKSSDEHTETVSDTVRHTEVEIEDDRGVTSTDPKIRDI